MRRRSGLGVGAPPGGIRRLEVLALITLALILALPRSAAATPPPGVSLVKLDTASGTLLVGVGQSGTVTLQTYDAVSGRPRAHPFDGLQVPDGAELELDPITGRLLVFVQDCPCATLGPGVHVFDPTTGRETAGRQEPLRPLGQRAGQVLAWNNGKLGSYALADLRQGAERDLTSHGSLRLASLDDLDRRLYLYLSDGRLLVLDPDSLATIAERDFGRQIVSSLVPNPFNHHLYVTGPDPSGETEWASQAYDLDAVNLIGPAPWPAALAWPDQPSGQLFLRLAADTEHPGLDRLIVMDGASETFIAEVSFEPLAVDFPHRRFYAQGVGLPLEPGQVRPTPVRIVDADSLAILATTPGDVFLDGADDGPLEHGWYYKQAGSHGLGFAVRPPLWDEYVGLGGPTVVGYPMSRAFPIRNGPAQVFERAVLRWDPGARKARYVLVFDALAAADHDPWLERFYGIPRRPAWKEDAGRAPAAVRAAHLALLDTDPAIQEIYLSNPSWAEQYGLPMAVADSDAALVLRAQGVVFFHWKVSGERGESGEINQAPLARVALESGWVPEYAIEPE